MVLPIEDEELMLERERLGVVLLTEKTESALAMVEAGMVMLVEALGTELDGVNVLQEPAAQHIRTESDKHECIVLLT